MPRPSTDHKRSRAFVARQGRSNVRSGAQINVNEDGTVGAPTSADDGSSVG